MMHGQNHIKFLIFSVDINRS